MLNATGTLLHRYHRGPIGGIAVLVLEIDGFGEIIDCLGRKAGDEVLVRVAAALRAALAAVFQAFTRETGYTIRYVREEPATLSRWLGGEGESMPTDVLLGVEIGLLLAARRADVLRPVQSDRLAARIPAAYRDEVGFWYGLTARAHAILVRARAGVAHRAGRLRNAGRTPLARAPVHGVCDGRGQPPAAGGPAGALGIRADAGVGQRFGGESGA